jgi:hypothetical protein
MLVLQESDSLHSEWKSELSRFADHFWLFGDLWKVPRELAFTSVASPSQWFQWLDISPAMWWSLKQSDCDFGQEKALLWRLHSGRMGVARVKQEELRRRQLHEGGWSTEKFSFQFKESIRYLVEEICMISDKKQRAINCHVEKSPDFCDITGYDDCNEKWEKCDSWLWFELYQW